MTDTLSSWKKYYQKNKDKILAKKREKYLSDIEYREEQKKKNRRRKQLRTKEEAHELYIRYRKTILANMRNNKQVRANHKKYSKITYHRHKEKIKEYAKESYDPLKGSARRKVYYALKKGRLIKPDLCQDCGHKKKLNAHHHDYTKPLDVIWLCRDCHGKQHRKYEFK